MLRHHQKSICGALQQTSGPLWFQRSQTLLPSKVIFRYFSRPSERILLRSRTASSHFQSRSSCGSLFSEDLETNLVLFGHRTSGVHTDTTKANEIPEKQERTENAESLLERPKTSERSPEASKGDSGISKRDFQDQI